MTSDSDLLRQILEELQAIHKCLKKPSKKKEPSKIKDTWTAYSRAMAERYGTAPPRNASINGLLSHFVARVGIGKAPSIAAYYVKHNNFWYTKNGHPVNLLLKDAEKLAVEWETGNVITDQQAKAESRKANNVNVFKGMMK